MRAPQERHHGREALLVELQIEPGIAIGQGGLFAIHWSRCGMER